MIYRQITARVTFKDGTTEDVVIVAPIHEYKALAKSSTSRPYRDARKAEILYSHVVMIQ